MITTKITDREHKGDINIPNQPFQLFGRMVPSYKYEKWSYAIVLEEHKNNTTKQMKGHKYPTCHIGR